MDISLHNCGRVAKSNAVIRALPRNDDTITLRSIIRRTRGVSLVSKGTLYERPSDALWEAHQRSAEHKVLGPSRQRHTLVPPSSSA